MQNWLVAVSAPCGRSLGSCIQEALFTFFQICVLSQEKYPSQCCGYLFQTYKYASTGDGLNQGSPESFQGFGGVEDVGSKFFWGNTMIACRDQMVFAHTLDSNVLAQNKRSSSTHGCISGSDFHLFIFYFCFRWDGYVGLGRVHRVFMRDVPKNALCIYLRGMYPSQGKRKKQKKYIKKNESVEELRWDVEMVRMCKI